MKALSLHQPWASLIAVGAKTIETRSWHASYRGPLLIHASAGKQRYAREFCEEPDIAELMERFGLTWETLPRGAIVAKTTLVDCYAMTPWRVEAIKKGTVPAPPAAEYRLGDLSLGRYAWVLQGFEALYEPIPAKGKLGIWEWEGEL